MICNMENETIVAERDMNVFGINIKKGTRVKRLTEVMISLTEVVEIGYYDAFDVVNEVKNKNNEDHRLALEYQLRALRK